MGLPHGARANDVTGSTPPGSSHWSHLAGSEPLSPPLPSRCEATETKCAALVATRAALTRELLAQAHSGAGAGDGAQAAAALAGMRGLEGRFAALDDQVMEVG